jgi:hypothetical protein
MEGPQATHRLAATRVRRDKHCDMSQLIPLAVLFGNPERVSPRLAPDGTQLAWIAPNHGVLNVWLAPHQPSGRR